ncbi:MAG: YceI family protein [Candidatus Omnitrophica bacterium]|nr:YceI family protein [Candidatus Omnitrophota bacterium]
MRQRVLAVILAASALWAAPCAWATTYTIDQNHTTVSFKIRHLFANVEGVFREFEGRFDYVPGHPEQWQANATIQAASIDTRVADRDTHLRSNDFFDVERYPTITFKTTQVTDATPTSAKLQGLLAIHGVEKPVVLDLTVHGEGKDPWGNIRSGFTATTTIHRKEFGLTWNKALETGQWLVGEEVMITLEVEGVVK